MRKFIPALVLGIMVISSAASCTVDEHGNIIVVEDRPPTPVHTNIPGGATRGPQIDITPGPQLETCFIYNADGTGSTEWHSMPCDLNWNRGSVIDQTGLFGSRPVLP